MIKALNIKNFKSIRNAQLDLGKITVLTGANNSGKSSFIFSLLALKNTIGNPNQSIDNCLTLPFINLGGFNGAVYLNDETQNIELECVFLENGIEIAYKLSIGKITSFLEITGIKPLQFNAKLQIAFPYPANKDESFNFRNIEYDAFYNWNGILASNISIYYLKPRFPDKMFEEHQKRKVVSYIEKIFQLPISEFSKIDFVPMRRGFTQPYYAPVPLGSQISTEEQIATLLGNDHELATKVAIYLEKIVDRRFSIYSPPGIASIYLKTRDNNTGFTSDLVNEGLGTNQLVTILAKVLQKYNKFICIDEPEIHLHPSIIDKLVAVLIEMAEHENKQFLVSTHSEHFVNSILKHVVEKEINEEDVKVYYLTKNGKETKVEYQQINADGQIKGGLKNFYDAELTNLKSFFKIAD